MHGCVTPVHNVSRRISLLPSETEAFKTPNHGGNATNDRPLVAWVEKELPLLGSWRAKITVEQITGPTEHLQLKPHYKTDWVPLQTKRPGRCLVMGGATAEDLGHCFDRFGAVGKVQSRGITSSREMWRTAQDTITPSDCHSTHKFVVFGSDCQTCPAKQENYL